MIELKAFRQKYDFDCGPACARMVLNYYGKTERYEEIIKGCGCSRKQKDGADGDGIASYLTKRGIASEYRMYVDYDDLKNYVHLGYPVIVSWFSPSPGPHWSVVVACGDNRIVLQDPAIGRKRYMTVEDFMMVWFMVDTNVDKKALNENIEAYVNIRDMIFPTEPILGGFIDDE